jgi:hypothetical protein
MHGLFWTYFQPINLAVESAIFLTVAGWALWRGFRPVEPWVDEWAAARGLTLTSDNRGVVVRRLRLGRRVRTVGFVAGWLVPYLWLWVTRDERVLSGSHPFFSIALVGGYLVAAVSVEVWFARQAATSGAAFVEPRSLGAYLPPFARRAPRYAALGAVVLVAIYASMPWRANEISWPSLPDYAMRALLVPAVVVGLEALQRLIVRRRQPFTSEPLLQADDALRSASVNTLAAVAIAVTCLICASLAWDLGGRSDVLVLRWVAPFGAMALIAFGLACFRTLTDPRMRWRVRRGRLAARQA